MRKGKHSLETRQQVARLRVGGLTERQVSELTGVPQGTVSRITQTTRLPSRRGMTRVEVEARKALAKALAKRRKTECL